MPSRSLGPVGSLTLVHAVHVRGVLHRAVGVAQLGREVALHQRKVAAHVEDLVEDLDVHRADLVACLAARARPQLLGGDPLEHRVGADRDVVVEPDRRGRPAAIAGRGHDLPDLQHDLARVERLAGGVRRAHGRAAATDRARVGVEELLPGEVLDLRCAERLELGLHQVRHAARIAPLGRSRSARYMFIGDVIMWRSFVVGRITRNATNAAAWTIHIVRCRSESVPCDQRDQSAESPQPTKDHSSKWAGSRARCGTPSMRKPVTPMSRKRRGSPRPRAWS